MAITLELCDLEDQYFEQKPTSKEETKVMYEFSKLFENHASDTVDTRTTSDLLTEFRSKFPVDQIFL